MSSPARPVMVGWKVNSLGVHMASVRYRALLPIAVLEAGDVPARLFDDAAESRLDGLDALVIVKSFTPDDLRLAQAARRRGLPVVFDLCDNVFVPGYAGRAATHSITGMFLAIARHVNCVVTTTEPLAEEIRRQLPRMRVVVIPDGIETPELATRMADVVQSVKPAGNGSGVRALRRHVRHVGHRLRSEGLRAVPQLLGSAARRFYLATARRTPVAGSRPVLPRDSVPASPAEARPQTHRILWFGNHGAEHGRFGMLDILEFRTALETLAQEHDVELVVISNHPGKFEENIRPLAIPSRYVEWSPTAAQDWLAAAAVVIVPNTLDAFSRCKSANRTVLALGAGVPVVATPTPALQPLEDFIHVGEPLAALREVLSRPGEARARAAAGYRLSLELFGHAALQGAWKDLLVGLLDMPRPDLPSRPVSMVVSLHLVQDLDLALPILQAAHRAGLACEAWCSTQLIGKSPRVLATLQREDIPLRILPDGEAELGRIAFPVGARILLTVAETNLGPHRMPRLLSEGAIRAGMFVATLQHGFENVGLTYDDALHGIARIDFAAHRIYTWGPAATLHARIAASVRERCHPVGCPKSATVPAAPLDGLVPDGRPVIGVFENLHWHRYSDGYRRSFIEGVQVLAGSFPQLFFLVKPHHAGAWLSARHAGRPPAADNLLIADPAAAEWESHTAAALLPSLAAVITTPSTVALDAARLGLPAAVVAGDLSLDNYRPLTLLDGPDTWIGFVEGALDPLKRPELVDRSTRFLDRVLVPGDAARRIVEDLQKVVNMGWSRKCAA